MAVQSKGDSDHYFVSRDERQSKFKTFRQKNNLGSVAARTHFGLPGDITKGAHLL